jgi:hypothetical protein
VKCHEDGEQLGRYVRVLDVDVQVVVNAILVCVKVFRHVGVNIHGADASGGTDGGDGVGCPTGFECPSEE